MFKILILLLVPTIYEAMGANILAVFPVPLSSEQQVYRILIQELANRGHEITVVTSDPLMKQQGSNNINEINLHDASYKIWKNYSRVIESNQKMDFVLKMSWILNGLNHVFLQQLNTKEMNNLINEKHVDFDLMLLEASVVSVLSLSHVFKIPVILVSSIGAVLDNYGVIGAPSHPFLYPSNLSHRVYNLTFWEKITMLYTQKRLEAAYQSIEDKVQPILNSNFDHDFPSLNVLKNNVEMLFLNVNPIWAGNQPVPPNVIFIGGIQPKNIEELSENVLSWLNNSKHGVVYVSFGDIIKPSLLSPNKILVILNVLSQIPYDVLLKWDVDSLPGVPKNIKIFYQLPQLSVLRHPKIKLFITNGGLQSTDDAINAGVPLVGIPMFADQWYNTEKYEHFGIGIQVDIDSITEENLMGALRTVINNESYKRNIIKLSMIMNDQPESPLDRAIWWTEYVLRHGGAKHLRAPAANMSWAEYYELRFVFMSLVFLCLIFVLLIVFVMIGFRFIQATFADTKKKLS